jgi:hypothetical protein
MKSAVIGAVPTVPRMPSVPKKVLLMGNVSVGFLGSPAVQAV